MIPRPTWKFLAVTALAALRAVPSPARADIPPPRRLEPELRKSSAGDDEAVGRRLQAVLRAHGGDVHGCYGIALAERPGIAGELLVRIWVAPGGAVERVEVLTDQVGSGRLTSCLTDAIRHWRAPELAGDDVQQLVFPLAFHDDATAARTSGKVRYLVPAAEVKPADGAKASATARLESHVLIDAASVGPTRASLTLLSLKPSARLALHQHPQAVEILYVLRGRAHLRGVTAGAPPDNAESGDVIYVPAGSGHNIEAAPLAPLDLVQIFAPGGPEQAYRDPARRDGTLAIGKTKKPAEPADAKTNPRVLHAAATKSYPILGGKGAAFLFLDGVAMPAAGSPSSERSAIVDQNVSLQRFEAEVGARVPPHRHDDSDEILYIASGKGRMTVGEETFTVAAGDAVHVPAKVEHGLEVTEKLVAVQCYAPGGPEQRFKVPPPAASLAPVKAPGSSSHSASTETPRK